MDQMTIYAACAAVHNDDGEAELWFRALIGTYQHMVNPSEWEEFRSALGASAAAAGLPETTVEQFVFYLDQQSGNMGIIADMSAQGAEELLEIYRGWLAQAAQDGVYGNPEGGMNQEVPPAEDESAWYAFLRENGRYWDRTPENWGAFRDWFLHTAAQAGVGTLATNFLDWAQEQPNPAAVFVEYGVTFDEPASAEQAGLTYDDGEQPYEPAATAGGYAEQDTTAENPADDEDADEGTEELIDLTPDALENLIEQRLAEAGDDEAGAEGAGARDEMAAEDEAAEPLTVEEAVDQVAGDIIAEFRSQHTEFEAMDDNDIRAMLAEIIAEEAGVAQHA